MDFEIPATKEEMYEVLEAIDLHYKGDLRLFEPPAFEALSLARMDYIPETEESLLARAAELVEYDYEEALAQYRDEQDALIAGETERKTQLAAEKQEALSAIGAEYDAAEIDLRREAEKRGILHSSAVVDRLASLAERRAAALTAARARCGGEEAACAARLAAGAGKTGDAPAAVLPLYESKRENALLALEKLEWDRAAEVLKYNNQAEEKEVKYSNSLLQSVAKLKLEFIQAAAQGYGEDQLVAMGYYKDVVAAVLGYYESLEPAAASADFNAERDLIIYLGSYYNNVSFYLSQRAAQT